MKTPQEVFKLMLEHWGECGNTSGICEKLLWMKVYNLIQDEEYSSAKYFLLLYKFDSIHKFNASEIDKLWWPEYNQEVRKQFVKYLSEIE